MPRINRVEKARKSKVDRTCSCGHVIQPGEAYKYITPRYGGTRYKCAEHSFRPTELSSSKMAIVEEAQLDLTFDGCETPDDVAANLQALSETAREVAGEYRESIENMPENFQQGATAEDMECKADALEEFADMLDGWGTDVDRDDFDDGEDGDADFLQAVIEEAYEVSGDLNY